MSDDNDIKLNTIEANTVFDFRIPTPALDKAITAIEMDTYSSDGGADGQWHKLVAALKEIRDIISMVK
jgi:hypothetical protein